MCRIVTSETQSSAECTRENTKTWWNLKIKRNYKMTRPFKAFLVNSRHQPDDLHKLSNKMLMKDRNWCLDGSLPACICRPCNQLK